MLDDLTPADESGSYIPEARRESGTLVLNLPSEAKVFVNGYRTTSTGAQRILRSGGMRPGKKYSYEIRTVVGSKAVTKFAKLSAGEKVEVDFDMDDLQAESKDETVLTLNVPDGSKVNLAGSDTNQTGSRRTFVTKKLANGQTWSDYVVKVSFERDGETVTRERNLTIRGGESYELNFDFDESLVASL